MKKFFATLTLAAFALTAAPVFGQDTPKQETKKEHKKKGKKKKSTEEKKEEKKG